MTKTVNTYSSKIKPVSKGFRIDLKKINISIFSLLSILGIFYLVSVSDLTVKGFALQELKSQAASVGNEKLMNEEAINKLQSYYSLSSRTKGLNMVAIGDIEYLNKNTAALAKK
ncbi:MAG: hypothetical protein ACYC40_02670 [Patescibacteria group bacterium]